MKVRTIKIILISVIGATVLVGGGYLALTWNQPLDSDLNLIKPTWEGAEVTQELDAGTTGSPAEITPSVEPICGAPPSVTILISGVASKDYLYGLADAIRVVRLDFSTPKVTVLALPRDLWVEIPGLEERGITRGKLNQAYFYGTEGMGYFSGGGYGAGLLAKTLLANYDFWMDHYISVNLRSFRRIIDALGGIDVTLPYDVYRKEFEQPVLFLKAGSHHLDGRQTEMLARQRIQIGDYGRINNQTIILKAVAAKMLSPAGIAALPDLAEQLRDNVKTDLSPSDIRQLVCLAGSIDYQEDIVFVTFPEELLTQQMVYDPTRGINTAALVGDPAEITRLIDDFEAGLWP